MAIKKAKANNIRYFLLIVLSNDYILNDLWNDGYLVIRYRQYSETFIPDYKAKANLDLTNIPISYTFANNSCHIAFRNYQLVTFIMLFATHLFSCC